jgi:DNA replication and repair protein RecF
MISDIRLQQFRSYKDELFEFDPGVNIIVGPNASGKTNLLEAIRVICFGGSYRSRDSELLMAKKQWARIDAHNNGFNRTVKLQIPHPSSLIVNKTFDIAGNVYKRLGRDQKVPLVLFEPNHLLFLTGSPELRRDFLDDLLEQTSPGFTVLRRQYKRTLAQRNALLKKGYQTKNQLFAWNVRLSELGGSVALRRQELIAYLEPSLQMIYRQLSKNSKVSVRLEYIPSFAGKDYTSSLLQKLESASNLDYERGFTAYGPHRDDLRILLAERSSATTASRGEIRTLLLGLKLLELELIEKETGQKPILLLDDVFGELDGARRRALTEFLREHQAFITTTDADIVVHHFIGKAHIIPLAPHENNSVSG